MIIFLNGKFLHEEEAKVLILTPGLMQGCGIFETMRACKGKIIYFDAHLNRFASGAKLIKLKLPYSLARIKSIIKEAIKLSGFKDCHVRLTLWKENRGPAILVVVKQYKPYPQGKYILGMRMKVSGLRASEDSLLTRLKSTSRLLYELSFQEAKDVGFDGSIILNSRGYLAEGSRSNIFFVKEQTLFTPDISCGCLPGITRLAILDLAGKYKIKACAGKFTLRDLIDSDEAFLTGSLSGIMPIASVEDKIIGKGRCGKLTEFLSKKYNSLLK